jgi:hypothetical protein
MLFSVPPMKAQRLKALARSAIIYAKTHRRWLSKMRLASITGLLISLRLAIPDCRTYAHSLYQAIASIKGWKGDVHLSAQALRDLQWIADLQVGDMQQLMLPASPSVTIFTDASTTAWGVTSALGEAQGFFNQQQVQNHITWKELQTVSRAVQHLGPKIRGRCVSLVTDNLATMAVVNKGLSKSRMLMSEYRLLFDLLRQYHVKLVASYINTKANTRADFLSRISVKSEWEISDLLFNALRAEWGDFTVDRFASLSTTKCKRYNSLALTPGSMGDAFAQSSTRHNNWLNPPFALVPRVLQKLRQDRAGGVLVVPYWPSQPWWPLLLQLSTYIKVLSITDTHLAVIPRSSVIPEPLRNPRWRLALVVVPFSLKKRLLF